MDKDKTSGWYQTCCPGYQPAGTLPEGDDPGKTDAVENQLDKVSRREGRLIFPSVVIAELAWVLGSLYKMEGPRIKAF